ncbi:8499_t:CDS:2, partial [Paraglomus occultum]
KNAIEVVDEDNQTSVSDVVDDEVSTTPMAVTEMISRQSQGGRQATEVAKTIFYYDQSYYAAELGQSFNGWYWLLFKHRKRLRPFVALRIQADDIKPAEV